MRTNSCWTSLAVCCTSVKLSKDPARRTTITGSAMGKTSWGGSSQEVLEEILAREEEAVM